jgi:hypothetical protein
MLIFKGKQNSDEDNWAEWNGTGDLKESKSDVNPERISGIMFSFLFRKPQEN